MANNSAISSEYLSSISNYVNVSTTTNNDKWLNFYGNYVELPPGQWDIDTSAFQNGVSGSPSIGTTAILLCISTSPANNDAETTLQPFSSADAQILANAGGYGTFYGYDTTPFNQVFLSGGNVWLDKIGPKIRVLIKNKTKIYVNGLFAALNTGAAGCAVAIYAKRVG